LPITRATRLPRPAAKGCSGGPAGAVGGAVATVGPGGGLGVTAALVEAGLGAAGVPVSMAARRARAVSTAHGPVR
jgi:hypothetical protein